MIKLTIPIYDFYSHAPRGARRRGGRRKTAVSRFLLTRPSRGATYSEGEFNHGDLISTHTPLAGRDAADREALGVRENFYSHAPRGARLDATMQSYFGMLFLLTRPSRGATALEAGKEDIQ